MATTLIHVSRDDLKEKIKRGEEFVLVDELSPLSYATSHLPGAISMPPERVDEVGSVWVRDDTGRVLRIRPQG
jgi:rhodanese-related sulfurtransferase